MTDILLINTPIFRENRDPESGNSVPPIGVGYIYTQLAQSGYECQFIDAVVNSLLPDKIIEIINQSDAEYIGLNIFSSNFNIVRSIVEKAESPRKFFLGGPAASTLITEIKGWNSKNSITVVTGDAELILPEIIKGKMQTERYSSNMNVVTVTPKSPFYPSNIDLPLDRSIFIVRGIIIGSQF